MDLQYFGTIDTPEGVATAMICMDADRPLQLFIQWFGPGIEPRGLLAGAVLQENNYLLKPLAIMRAQPNASGALFVPVTLTAEELSFRDGVTASLTASTAGLTGYWTAVDGTVWSMDFPKTVPLKVKSTIVRSWKGFKNWADAASREQLIKGYRGHGCSSFSLQTKLHRSGRTDLHKYLSDELSEFSNQAQANLGRHFDLTNPQQYSTILGLAQHHGLPTNLLDWTSSPYIAAFFAFADAVENSATRPKSKYVRVYGLTRNFVASHSPTTVHMLLADKYASSLAVPPIHNPRMQAQQGFFLATNVSDLETYMCADDRTDLVAVDIPIRFAPEALVDLAFMGLTAATMFPGLDGIGRMLMHRMITANRRTI